MRDEEDRRYRAAAARQRRERSKALRPWYRKKRFVVPPLLVVVVLIAAWADRVEPDTPIAAGNAVGSDFSRNEEHPPGADVSIVSCERSPIGWVDFGLEVINNSSKESDYFVSVGVEDSTGAKVGDGFASMRNVGPGQPAKVDGIATLSEAAEGNFTCTLDEVERFAS